MQSQSTAIEDLVASFRDHLTRIVAEARRDVARKLADRLNIVDGLIDNSPANARILYSVNAWFQAAMRRAGYQRAVAQFVGQFSGQFPFFQETLDMLGKQIGRDLKIDFSARDRALFAQQQAGYIRLIDGVVDTVAASAERQAMLSVGGLKLGALIDAIVQKLDATVPQASTLADTALSTFYRTLTDRGLRTVEQDLPDRYSLKFKYGGPNDRLVRPTCRLWLAQSAAGKLWTRADIDRLSNGQLPSVFLTCGGYNCRHQWLVMALEKDAIRRDA